MSIRLIRVTLFYLIMCALYISTTVLSVKSILMPKMPSFSPHAANYFLKFYLEEQLSLGLTHAS